MLQDYQIQEIAEKYVEEAKNFSSYAWHYISEERAIDLLSGAISDGLEAFALTSDVSELKRKLMETAFEREKMLNALILCSDALLVSTTALPEDREMVLQAQQAARKAIGNE